MREVETEEPLDIGGHKSDESEKKVASYLHMSKICHSFAKYLNE
jgi:hypothetical protein